LVLKEKIKPVYNKIYTASQAMRLTCAYTKPFSSIKKKKKVKTKFIILLIILIQISCKEEKSELERSWILVEQIAKPNSGGMYKLRGLLVDFEDDRMTYSYITAKDETEKKYWIEDNVIKFDTATFGKIIHLSEDSLIIEEDTNSFEMHFRPLEDFNFSKVEKKDIFQNLIKNSWSIQTVKSNQVFYCDTMVYSSWMSEEENDARCIVYETRNKDWKGITDYEWWTLKHFNNKLVLGISYHQTENAFFQMTGNLGQEINGQYIGAFDNNWTKVKLKKGQVLSSKRLDEMREMIIGDWEIENTIEPNLDMLDSVEFHSELTEESRTIENKKTGITKTNLKENAINFSFKRDGTFQIKANDKEIRSGNLWELTNDGQYIKLEKGIVGNNFIKILNLKDNKFQILKKEMIDSEVQKGMKFFQTFLNLELIKKEN
jgi:hypothetical protein